MPPISTRAKKNSKCGARIDTGNFFGVHEPMKTTRDVIAAIGRDRFKEMLSIGDKSVSRAETTNSFTASWYEAIRLEMEERGMKPVTTTLFNFKERPGKPV